ncbi:7543_t:CDS:10 [Paraglomus brasilianum]|uniref:7543_t:CDS:1 n=1 Tax=Paraglomus brasilianum TaxID=144538 RepID=A0A9N9B989_9GLOM|nr:7543_t:CDS:10 [Paraglomus brasilianum]
MPRRKKDIDDGLDSSSEEEYESFDITEADLLAESELFAGKLHILFTKEEAYLGVFAETEADENESRRKTSEVRFVQSRAMSPTREQFQRTRAKSKETENFEQYGIGFKLLQKQGFQPGKGLGKSGEGIAEPILVKPRPTKMGLAYRNFQERTQQEIDEDRTRLDAGKEAEKAEESRPQRKKAWKKSAEKKVKITYKTADEIMKEASSFPAMQPIKIIDMTGPQIRELSSASEISSRPKETFTRLPELRHNLMLLADKATANLEHLTRELRIQEQRTKVLEQEVKMKSALLEEKENVINDFSGVFKLINECYAILTSSKETVTPSLYVFSEPFEKLQTEYEVEYEQYGLDAVVIGLITPIFKRSIVDWDPLEDPTLNLSAFQQWLPLLKMNLPASRRLATNNSKFSSQVAMTPYESMMYNIWLPKLRSAINNTWKVRDFDPVIALLEKWKPPLLPRFIYDNIVDQLIMPKIQKEVDNWNPREDKEMIHHWLHPWLPIFGDRMEPLYVIIRQKLRVALRTWHPRDPSAFTILFPWKNVFRETDMQSFLRKSILPKLVEVLRDEFEVNPRDQILDSFKWVTIWRFLFPPEVLGQVFVTEFFPKWLDVLYIWLTHSPNYEEIDQWYSFWESQFPSKLLSTPTINAGFKQGWHMINQGRILGDQTATRLTRPSQVPEAAADTSSIQTAAVPMETQTMAEDFSFREVVEDFAQEHNHLFLPAHKTHAETGKALFRFGGTVQSTGGVLVYLDDDVMFAQEGNDWLPMSFDEVLEKVEIINSNNGR